nr:prolyl oligopeptidase family serine peptidase [Corynebacterium lactis]
MRQTYESSLSPDGRAIAFIVRDRGYPHAVQQEIMPEGLGEERPVKLPVEGPVTRVLHSPNGKWIACEVSPRGTERLETWLVSTDPAVDGARPLRMGADMKTTLVEWDNELLAMNAVDASGINLARLVNPANSSYEVIDRRTDSQLVAAEGGFGLVRVGPRGHRELLLVGPDKQWYPLLPTDPGSTTEEGVLLAHAEGDNQHGQHDSAALTAFVLSDHGAEQRRVLKLGITKAGRSIDVDVEEFIGNPDQDVEEFVISEDASTAAVLWNSGGVTALEVLTLGVNPHNGDLRVTVRRNVDLPGMVARELSISGDGELISVTVEGPGLTPTVEILRNVGGVIEPLDTARTERILALEESNLESTPAPELVYFVARDGLELSGWLYLPESVRAGSGAGSSSGHALPPAFIHIHGGPELQAKPIHHDILASMVEAGMVVFTPNLRGSSGSGRAFEHAGDRYGRFAAIGDIAAARDFLVDAGLADPERIALGGRSYGGFMSLLASAWYPEDFAAIIDACGMTSFETYYQSTEPWLAQAAFPRYGYPYQDAELLRDISPLHRAEEMRTPTLFIHGEWDTNVPPRESGQMRNALDAYGVPTAMLMVEGEGHKFSKPKSRRLIGQTMISFLAEHGVLEGMDNTND